jgi:hypothetical protein
MTMERRVGSLKLYSRPDGESREAGGSGKRIIFTETQRGLGPQPKHVLRSSIEIMKRFLTGLTGFTRPYS